MKKLPRFTALALISIVTFSLAACGGDKSATVSTTTAPSSDSTDVPLDASPTIRSSPVEIPGLGSGATAITAGLANRCVIGAGAAKCWGNNENGQLGDGTTTDSSTPVQVQGLESGVTSIVSGGYFNGDFMCAVVSGAAKCWGQNGYGQLGDGTTTDSSTPVQVQGLERGVTSIAAFDDYSCAIVSGAAKCWGSYDHYRLGDGTTGNSSSTPVQMEGLERGVTSIAAGSVHTCAIVSGTVKCWGWNDDGQLGDGTTTDSTTPVQVRGLERGVTAIAVGTAYTCAVVSGAAKCWGLSSYGQIGDGTSVVRSSTPVQVKGLEGGVTEISSGHFHACAIVSGAAKCWGLNSFGQLGNGSKTGESSSTPVQVKGLESGVTSIGSFEDFGTCAIVSGAAKCWGGM